VSGSDATRAAHAEALFREVNERIAENVVRFEGDEGDFVCECSDTACAHRITVPLEDYERVREQSERFLLTPGHEDESIERTVGDGEGYRVVEKTAPAVLGIVRRLDPRAV
jgi:hypothetical protein